MMDTSGLSELSFPDPASEGQTERPDREKDPQFDPPSSPPPRPARPEVLSRIDTKSTAVRLSREIQKHTNGVSLPPEFAGKIHPRNEVHQPPTEEETHQNAYVVFDKRFLDCPLTREQM